MTKTLLVMAGGTGGHVFPGLAVADVLKARGWNVVWMGNPNGMEATLVPSRGYEMAWVRFGALRGKGLLRKLLLPFALLSGFWQARREIRRVKPDVVLGMGGYISFPGGMMAVLQGCPLVIHEQNSIAGLANRVLARIADRVVCGFPNALPKSQWLGNPVRPEIAKLPAPARGPAPLAPLAQRAAAFEPRLPVQILGGPDLTLSCDAAQIEQVLINLIKNAVEAALEQRPAGRGEAGVRIGWKKTAHFVEIAVEDDGPGIANASNLFVPFFTTKPEGSGIGLVLCRQIAENHGGSLALANRHSADGCLATLRLPGQVTA